MLIRRAAAGEKSNPPPLLSVISRPRPSRPCPPFCLRQTPCCCARCSTSTARAANHVCQQFYRSFSFRPSVTRCTRSLSSAGHSSLAGVLPGHDAVACFVTQQSSDHLRRSSPTIALCRAVFHFLSGSSVDPTRPGIAQKWPGDKVQLARFRRSRISL